MRIHILRHLTAALQIFRFASSKNESLFLQRKNPRKIAWTQVFRRMHKKGITEEVAKKRSRKSVKHQRGIVGVGADLQSILAKRNQTDAIRAVARQQAIAKAKEGKKAKEATKAKPKVGHYWNYHIERDILKHTAGYTNGWFHCSQGLETASQGYWRWRWKD